ncbi:flippase [Roseivivax sediminis]|uniref:Membrane protein involved in the export of O-antigen and teichoic acid n=1 Tax=Roseivivax sediminis TaxID=936889 RepID=A0A1I2CVF4_9RHOB|nr:flippase [Roseivivax sediminis]SFE72286.1 Membrane protein involved in the export of O-antigen and teichoic acid [Roseivivax sediminis]
MTLGRQSIFGIAIKAFSILLGFLVVAILARVLSPAVYGIYSVALASVTIMAIPTAMGLPNYVVREIAGALSEDNPRLARQIFRAAVTLVLMLAAVVVAGALIWTLVIHSSDQTGQAVLWLGLGLVPAMALTQVTGAALRGVGGHMLGLLVGQVLRHLLFLCLLVVWVLLPASLTGGLSALSAMGLHALAATLALSVGLLIWWRLQPALQGATTGAQLQMRAMLGSTGVMGVISGAQILNDNLDVIMLGILDGAEAAGLYKLGATAALVTVAGLQAINMVMMPHFARLHREGNTAALQALATRSVRLILLTALPTSVLLVALGRPLISLAFGPEYIDSYLPMVIRVTGQLVSALFGSVITILNMTGHEVDTMKGVLLGTLVNVVLNALLIPIYGPTGAAIATAITVVAWNIYLHRLVRKRLAINSTPFPFLNVAR